MSRMYRILSLDGGGSKGVYTIGILKELEKRLGSKLCNHFELIYGTSTGSIIASLISIGKGMEEIESLYTELIPKIMAGNRRREKSSLLRSECEKIFADQKFSDFKTDIGIVAMNYDEQKPLIFKRNVSQAHGLKSSFEPGFGCSIVDAIMASCAAYPIFNVMNLDTNNQGRINSIDGGFIANNPVLFALIDASKAIDVQENDIRILSVGVGKFVEKPINWRYRLIGKLKFAGLVERVLSANTNTNEILAKLIFPDLRMVRISETFNQPEYGTNMIERDIGKLNQLQKLGRNSYAKFEKEIADLFCLK